MGLSDGPHCGVSLFFERSSSSPPCGAHFLSRDAVSEGVRLLGLREPVVAARLASLRLPGRAKAPVPTLDQIHQLRLFGLRVSGRAATSGPERISRFHILAG